MLREKIAALIIPVAILAGVSDVFAADPAVSLNPNSSGGWPVAGSNHGWEFTVNEEITVTLVGLFDQDENGFEIDHPIGLWRLSDSALLASGTMSAGTGDTLIDHFRYIDIPDVDLSVSVDYVIGFYSASDDADWDISEAGDLQVNPAISIAAARWDVAGTFQMPANLVQDPDNPDRFGPNFQFVPEPATLLLLSLGGLLLRRRKSR